MFRLPPLTLWTPLTPQRTRGCSPLVTPKRLSSGKNRAVCPAAQTLFRFFPSSDLKCCARGFAKGGRFAGFAFRRLALLGTNPLSRLRRQLSRRVSLWQRGKVLRLQVNGMKKLTCKQQTSRPCQRLPLSGELATPVGVDREGSGTHPLQPVTSLPKASGPALCSQKKNLARADARAD